MEWKRPEYIKQEYELVQRKVQGKMREYHAVNICLRFCIIYYCL